MIYDYGTDRVTGARLEGRTRGLNTIGGYDDLASLNAGATFASVLDRGVAVVGVRWDLPPDTAPAVAQAHANGTRAGWLLYLKQAPRMLQAEGHRKGLGGQSVGWNDDDLWQGCVLPASLKAAVSR